MASSGNGYSASSEKDYRNHIEAGEFVYRVKEHLKDRPDDFKTFKNILANHNTGQFNKLVVYIIMYAFLYSIDSLCFLEFFQVFMPDNWSISDLKWLHRGIEAAQGDNASLLRWCARASSYPAGPARPAPPLSSMVPTDERPKPEAHQSQAGASSPGVDQAKSTPMTPSKFGVHRLHRPLRPSPLRTSTVLFPGPTDTTIPPTPSQESTDVNIDPRLHSTWNVPSTMTKHIDYDNFPEPSPLHSPLLSEEEKQQHEVLMRHVKRALDSQAAVFVSDEKRAQGLEELRAITETALRTSMGI